MESIKRALENIGRMWATLTATQRVVIGAAAVLMVVVLIFTSAGTAQAWVRVAGPEVDASTRATILNKLRERNQKHEARGAEIFVPKEDADRIVLELAGDGAMSDDVIWKFLEDSNPFIDRRQKDLRYKRALEQKLSAMIRRVEFVRNAMVVITPGSESDRVGFEGNRAKASVQVDLQEGAKLSNKNVVAIANLIAKAVTGLDPDQVVISDNKLNSYSLPKQIDGSMQALWFRDYERQIEEDIQSRIKQAFRTASVTVRITARNSRIAKQTVRNTNPKVIREEERKSVEKGRDLPTGRGLKGEEGVIQAPDQGGKTDQELRTEFTHDQDKIQEETPAGKIERITIGVLIPVEVGPQGTELAEAEKQKAKITSWVLAAADAPEKSVTVDFIPTQKLEPVPPAEESAKALAWIWSNWPKVVLGLLAAFAVWVVVRVIQRSGAQDTVEELQALTTALTETQEGPAGLVPPAETDLARLRQGIQDMVGRSPQTVAASLKSFMSGR